MASHTRIQLWEVYITKNPHWENDNITLTPAGLKKLFEQTYDLGYKKGEEVAKVDMKIKEVADAYTKKKDTAYDAANPLSGIFGDLFDK